MKLVYIDDSGDDQRDISCFSALVIDATQWYACSQLFERMRQKMKDEFGIYTSRELHATDFLAGKGRIASQPIDRSTRVKIFARTLRFFTKMPLKIINVVMKYQEKEEAFDWLLNRIDINIRRSTDHGIVIADDGKDYNKMLSLKRESNPIYFEDDISLNAPIQHIIERIWFRESSSCHFLQAADFCAYALLRKEAPSEKHKELGIDRLFHLLEPALVKEACRYDPHGIIRRRKKI